jgi:hypothetical protein
VSYPSGIAEINPCASAISAAASISLVSFISLISPPEAFAFSFPRDIFSLIVPVNSDAVCGTIAIFLRKSVSAMLFTGTPDIKISPPDAS